MFFPQNKKYSPALRIIAFVLIVAFIWADISHAAPLDYQRPISNQQDFGNLIPEALGRVSEVFIPKGQVASSKGQGTNLDPGPMTLAPIVFYIQDAHANLGAQQNIQKIARLISEKFGVRTILAEGASGTADLFRFRNYPNQKVKELATRFWLEQVILTGIEAEAVLNPKSYELIGAEDAALYDSNRKEFLKALEVQKELLPAVHFLFKENQEAKEKTYNKRLLEFETKTGLYEQRGELISLISHLANIGRNEGVKRSDLYEIEKLISLVLLERSLTGVKAGEKIDEKKEFERISREIGAVNLFREISLFKDRVRERLFSGKGEEGLHEEGEYLKSVKALVSLQATPEDFLFYQQHKKEITKFLKGKLDPKKLNVAEQFYTTSKRRDEAFLNSVKRYALSDKSDLTPNAYPLPPGSGIILVTGGFHAEDLTEKFRKENIPFVLISPQVSPETDYDRYYERMNGETPTFEKLKPKFEEFLKSSAISNPLQVFNSDFNPQEYFNSADPISHRSELRLQPEFPNLSQIKKLTQVMLIYFSRWLFARPIDVIISAYRGGQSSFLYIPSSTSKFPDKLSQNIFSMLIMIYRELKKLNLSMEEILDSFLMISRTSESYEKLPAELKKFLETPSINFSAEMKDSESMADNTGFSLIYDETYRRLRISLRMAMLQHQIIHHGEIGNKEDRARLFEWVSDYHVYHEVGHLAYENGVVGFKDPESVVIEQTPHRVVSVFLDDVASDWLKVRYVSRDQYPESLAATLTRLHYDSSRFRDAANDKNWKKSRYILKLMTLQLGYTRALINKNNPGTAAENFDNRFLVPIQQALLRFASEVQAKSGKSLPEYYYNPDGWQATFEKFIDRAYFDDSKLASYAVSIQPSQQSEKNDRSELRAVNSQIQKLIDWAAGVPADMTQQANVEAFFSGVVKLAEGKEGNLTEIERTIITDANKSGALASEYKQGNPSVNKFPLRAGSTFAKFINDQFKSIKQNQRDAFFQLVIEKAKSAQPAEPQTQPQAAENKSEKPAAQSGIASYFDPKEESVNDEEIAAIINANPVSTGNSALEIIARVIANTGLSMDAIEGVLPPQLTDLLDLIEEMIEEKKSKSKTSDAEGESEKRSELRTVLMQGNKNQARRVFRGTTMLFQADDFFTAAYSLRSNLDEEPDVQEKIRIEKVKFSEKIDRMILEEDQSNKNLLQVLDELKDSVLEKIESEGKRADHLLEEEIKSKVNSVGFQIYYLWSSRALGESLEKFSSKFKQPAILSPEAAERDVQHFKAILDIFNFDFQIRIRDLKQKGRLRDAKALEITWQFFKYNTDSIKLVMESLKDKKISYFDAFKLYAHPNAYTQLEKAGQPIPRIVKDIHNAIESLKGTEGTDEEKQIKARNREILSTLYRMMSFLSYGESFKMEGMSEELYQEKIKEYNDQIASAFQSAADQLVDQAPVDNMPDKYSFQELLDRFQEETSWLINTKNVYPDVALQYAYQKLILDIGTKMSSEDTSDLQEKTLLNILVLLKDAVLILNEKMARQLVSDQQFTTDKVDHLVVILKVSKEQPYLAGAMNAPTLLSLKKAYPNLGAVVAEFGSPTEHWVIVGANYGILVLTALKAKLGKFADIKSGQIIYADGENGMLHANPSQKDAAEYEQKIVKEEAYLQLAKTLALEPVFAKKDSVASLLMEVSGSADALEHIQELSADTDGVRLYRTEVNFPTHFYRHESWEANIKEYEDDLTQILSQGRIILRGAFAVRTLDRQLDKPVSAISETNTKIGFDLYRDPTEGEPILRAQIRAAIRASIMAAEHFHAEGETGRESAVKVFVPMVQTEDDVIFVRTIFDQELEKFRHDLNRFRIKIPFGIMIETNKAIENLPVIAQKKYVDFISIGTNDLLQQTFGRDREYGGRLYTELLSTFLEKIETIIEHASAAGLEVSICGEMAGWRRFMLFLIYMKGKYANVPISVAVSPAVLAILKQLIRFTAYEDVESIFYDYKDWIPAERKWLDEIGKDSQKAYDAGAYENILNDTAVDMAREIELEIQETPSFQELYQQYFEIRQATKKSELRSDDALISQAKRIGTKRFVGRQLVSVGHGRTFTVVFDEDGNTESMHIRVESVPKQISRVRVESVGGSLVGIRSAWHRQKDLDKIQQIIGEKNQNDLKFDIKLNPSREDGFLIARGGEQTDLKIIARVKLITSRKLETSGDKDQRESYFLIQSIPGVRVLPVKNFNHKRMTERMFLDLVQSAKSKIKVPIFLWEHIINSFSQKTAQEFLISLATANIKKGSTKRNKKSNVESKLEVFFEPVRDITNTLLEKSKTDARLRFAVSEGLSRYFQSFYDLAMGLGKSHAIDVFKEKTRELIISIHEFYFDYHKNAAFETLERYKMTPSKGLPDIYRQLVEASYHLNKMASASQVFAFQSQFHGLGNLWGRFESRAWHAYLESEDSAERKIFHALSGLAENEQENHYERAIKEKAGLPSTIALKIPAFQYANEHSLRKVVRRLNRAINPRLRFEMVGNVGYRDYAIAMLLSVLGIGSKGWQLKKRLEWAREEYRRTRSREAIMDQVFPNEVVSNDETDRAGNIVHPNVTDLMYGNPLPGSNMYAASLIARTLIAIESDFAKNPSWDYDNKISRVLYAYEALLKHDVRIVLRRVIRKFDRGEYKIKDPKFENLVDYYRKVLESDELIEQLMPFQKPAPELVFLLLLWTDTLRQYDYLNNTIEYLIENDIFNQYRDEDGNITAKSIRPIYEKDPWIKGLRGPQRTIFNQIMFELGLLAPEDLFPESIGSAIQLLESVKSSEGTAPLILTDRDYPLERTAAMIRDLKQEFGGYAAIGRWRSSFTPVGETNLIYRGVMRMLEAYRREGRRIFEHGAASKRYSKDKERWFVETLEKVIEDIDRAIETSDDQSSLNLIDFHFSKASDREGLIGNEINSRLLHIVQKRITNDAEKDWPSERKKRRLSTKRKMSAGAADFQKRLEFHGERDKLFKKMLAAFSEELIAEIKPDSQPNFESIPAPIGEKFMQVLHQKFPDIPFMMDWHITFMERRPRETRAPIRIIATSKAMELLKDLKKITVDGQDLKIDYIPWKGELDRFAPIHRLRRWKEFDANVPAIFVNIGLRGVQLKKLPLPTFRQSIIGAWLLSYSQAYPRGSDPAKFYDRFLNSEPTQEQTEYVYRVMKTFIAETLNAAESKKSELRSLESMNMNSWKSANSRGNLLLSQITRSKTTYAAAAPQYAAFFSDAWFSDLDSFVLSKLIPASSDGEFDIETAFAGFEDLKNIGSEARKSFEILKKIFDGLTESENRDAYHKLREIQSRFEKFISDLGTASEIETVFSWLLEVDEGILSINQLANNPEKGRSEKLDEIRKIVGKFFRKEALPLILNLIVKSNENETVSFVRKTRSEKIIQRIQKIDELAKKFIEVESISALRQTALTALASENTAESRAKLEEQLKIASQSSAFLDAFLSDLKNSDLVRHFDSLVKLKKELDEFIDLMGTSDERNAFYSWLEGAHALTARIPPILQNRHLNTVLKKLDVLLSLLDIKNKESIFFESRTSPVYGRLHKDFKSLSGASDISIQQARINLFYETMMKVAVTVKTFLDDDSFKESQTSSKWGEAYWRLRSIYEDISTQVYKQWFKYYLGQAKAKLNQADHLVDQVEPELAEELIGQAKIDLEKAFEKLDKVFSRQIEMNRSTTLQIEFRDLALAEGHRLKLLKSMMDSSRRTHLLIEGQIGLIDKAVERSFEQSGALPVETQLMIIDLYLIFGLNRQAVERMHGNIRRSSMKAITKMRDSDTVRGMRFAGNTQKTILRYMLLHHLTGDADLENLFFKTIKEEDPQEISKLVDQIYSDEKYRDVTIRVGQVHEWLSEKLEPWQVEAMSEYTNHVGLDFESLFNSKNQLEVDHEMGAEVRKKIEEAILNRNPDQPFENLSVDQAALKEYLKFSVKEYLLPDTLLKDPDVLFKYKSGPNKGRIMAPLLIALILWEEIYTKSEGQSQDVVWHPRLGTTIGGARMGEALQHMIDRGLLFVPPTNPAFGGPRIASREVLVDTLEFAQLLHTPESEEGKEIRRILGPEIMLFEQFSIRLGLTTEQELELVKQEVLTEAKPSETEEQPLTGTIEETAEEMLPLRLSEMLKNIDSTPETASEAPQPEQQPPFVSEIERASPVDQWTIYALTPAIIESLFDPSLTYWDRIRIIVEARGITHITTSELFNQIQETYGHVHAVLSGSKQVKFTEVTRLVGKLARILNVTSDLIYGIRRETVLELNADPYPPHFADKFLPKNARQAAVTNRRLEIPRAIIGKTPLVDSFENSSVTQEPEPEKPIEFGSPEYKALLRARIHADLVMRLPYRVRKELYNKESRMPEIARLTGIELAPKIVDAPVKGGKGTKKKIVQNVTILKDAWENKTPDIDQYIKILPPFDMAKAVEKLFDYLKDSAFLRKALGVSPDRLEKILEIKDRIVELPEDQARELLELKKAKEELGVFEDSIATTNRVLKQLDEPNAEEPVEENVRSELRSGQSIAELQKELSGVSILNAGGTIDMIGEFARKTVDAVRVLLTHLKNTVFYKSVFDKNPDSTNIGPKEWEKIIDHIKDEISRKTTLAEEIKVSQREMGGIILTHGTDTLAETGLVLSLEFDGSLPTRIVLTGSSTVNEKEKILNLKAAEEVAKRTDIPNLVYVVIDSQIYLGSLISKIRTDSSSKGSLFASYGKAIGAVDSKGNISFDMDFLQTVSSKLANLEKQPKFHKNEEFGYVEHLLIDETTPALVLFQAGNRIERHAEQAGVRAGLVIQGDFSKNPEIEYIRATIQSLKRKKIPVVSNVSQSGAINIPYHMTFSKARTKLSWLLRAGVSFESLERELKRDFMGEAGGLWGRTDIPDWAQEKFQPNSFRQGREIVLAFPGIIPEVFIDASNRLLISGDSNKKELLVREFGDGNVPLENRSIQDILLTYLTRHHPDLADASFYELPFIDPEKDMDLERRLRQKISELSKDERIQISNLYQIENPRLLTNQLISEATKGQKFSNDAQRVLKIQEFIQENFPAWPRFGEVKTTDELIRILDEKFSDLTFLEQEEFFLKFPKYLARWIIKDALTNANPILKVISEIEDKSVQVKILTNAVFGRTNLQTYELGNMLMAVGADGQKSRGWKSALVRKDESRSELRTSDEALIEHIRNEFKDHFESRLDNSSFHLEHAVLNHAAGLHEGPSRILLGLTLPLIEAGVRYWIGEENNPANHFSSRITATTLFTIYETPIAIYLEAPKRLGITQAQLEAATKVIKEYLEDERVGDEVEQEADAARSHPDELEDFPEGAYRTQYLDRLKAVFGETQESRSELRREANQASIPSNVKGNIVISFEELKNRSELREAILADMSANPGSKIEFSVVASEFDNTFVAERAVEELFPNADIFGKQSGQRSRLQLYTRERLSVGRELSADQAYNILIDRLKHELNAKGDTTRIVAIGEHDLFSKLTRRDIPKVLGRPGAVEAAQLLIAHNDSFNFRSLGDVIDPSSEFISSLMHTLFSRAVLGKAA